MLLSSKDERSLQKRISGCRFHDLSESESRWSFPICNPETSSLCSRRERFREEAKRRQIAEDRGPPDEHVCEGRRVRDAQLPNNRREEIRRGVAAQQQGDQAQQGLPVHQRG